MKLKLFIFALLAIMATSCERNIDIPEPVEQEGDIVTISATIPEETRVSYDDGTLKLAWEQNDTLLLAGYDAGGTYIASSKFGHTGNDNEFIGTKVQGATTYKAYYPGDVITLDENGEVQLPADFWQQTQNGDNSTAHLSKKLLMSDVDANALNQPFTLTSQSSIVRLNLNNIPPEVGTLQKVIWSLQTSAEGSAELAILIVAGLSSGTTSLTAFLAFDPAVMRIVENGEVKVTLIGSQSSYEWSTNTTKVGGMTYEAGKRYHATVNGVWVDAKAKFRFTIQTAEASQLYEIWQKDASSTSPAELTISWGDGTANTTIAKNASLAKTIADHTYASPGNYTITITSDEVDPIVKQMPQITFFNEDNYARDEQLTAILDPFPNMGATDFFACFAACEKLNSFPAELFRYNTQATNFNCCFLSCAQLNSIPGELFKYNTSATNLSNCFFDCTGLTGSIPAELFKHNTKAMYFAACFQGCTGLTGSIPENLFRYNTQAISFTSCFNGCTGLNGSIPAELFKYNTQAKHFNSCFFGCTGLTGSIPENLFRYNTQAQKFNECFNGCTQLSGTIPAELFKYNTEATGFSGCFTGWQQLTEIPAELFRYNTQAQDFMGCFNSCSQLSAIPADLFRYNTQAKYFKYCFNDCTGLITIPIDLFRYNTNVTTFAYCFSGCTQLNSVPADLFRYNTQVQYFYHCFSGCTELSSLPADLFRYNTQAQYFLRCFYDCTKLQLRADIFPDPETNPNFFEGRTMNFKECFTNVGSYYTTPTGTAPKLWGFTGGGEGTTWTITDCFIGANVVNRSFIPISWGGDAAESGKVTDVDGEYW